MQENQPEINTAEMSEEERQSFINLQNRAAESEPSSEQNQTAPDTPKLNDEIAGIVNIVLTIVKPMLPSIEPIWTENTVITASSAIAAVCDKHGWLQGGLMGEYKEELTCAFVLLPLVVATRGAIQHDMAVAKAKLVKQSPETVAQQSEGVVTAETHSPMVGEI